MLPKEEKIKKIPDDKQPGLFDKEDERKRLTKKRRFIYLALILTTGLSLSFWIYRSAKNANFSIKIPSINLPKFKAKSLSIKTTANISLPKDSDSSWSIFLKRIDTDSIIYQHNQENIELNSVLTKIDKTNLATTSAYTSTLPQGLKIKEIIQEDTKNFSYFSKITTPSQELFLIIKTIDPKDLAQAKKSLPDLINQLYWYSLEK